MGLQIPGHTLMYYWKWIWNGKEQFQEHSTPDTPREILHYQRVEDKANSGYQVYITRWEYE